jgi:hypothetical protein
VKRRNARILVVEDEIAKPFGLDEVVNLVDRLLERAS